MLAAHARTAVGCRTARAVGSIPSMSGGSDAKPRTRPTRTRPASRGRRAAAASARARDDGSIEDDGDDSADWRAGPAPDSLFGSMFAEALAEASSSDPPPLKRVRVGRRARARARDARDPTRRRRDRRGAPQRGRGPDIRRVAVLLHHLRGRERHLRRGRHPPPPLADPARGAAPPPRVRGDTPDPTHRRLAAVARGRIRRRRRGVRRSRHRGRVPRQGVHPPRGLRRALAAMKRRRRPGSSAAGAVRGTVQRRVRGARHGGHHAGRCTRE